MPSPRQKRECSDPITCHICIEDGVADPYQGASIITHLNLIHGITAKEYKAKYNKPFISESLRLSFKEYVLPKKTTVIASKR